MDISGPIKANFLSNEQFKILFFSDCHSIGNVCRNGTFIFEKLKDLPQQPFLILAEGSLDVESVYENLDMVRYANFLKRHTLPKNFRVEFTDIRRTGTDDYFWLDDLFRKNNISGLGDFQTKLALLEVPQEREKAKLIEKMLVGTSQPALEMLNQKILTYQISDRNNENLIILTAFIMDLYTLGIIKKAFRNNIRNVLYYAGEVHINHLIELLEMEFVFENYEYLSNFKIFCQVNDCNQSAVMEESLRLPESKCVKMENFTTFF